MGRAAWVVLAGLGTSASLAGCGSPNRSAEVAAAAAAVAPGGTYLPSGPDGAAWDRLVVVGPYTTRDEAASLTGISAGDLPASEVWDGIEGQCLVMFVEGTEVVGSADVERKVADFCPGTFATITLAAPAAFVKVERPQAPDFPEMRPVP